jgi:hypothetical protein
LSNWSPSGFELYRQHYPATPMLAPPVHDLSAEFARQWAAAESPTASAPSGYTCVFVRGLFGNWIPRHFAAPLQRLRDAGIEAFIAHGWATGTLEVNAALLRADLEARQPGGRLLFLCHSKGGLDLLTMLAAAPHWRERTAGVVFCQTPRAGCAVLESVLLDAHAASSDTGQRARELAARTAILLSGAREACLELTAPRMQARIDALAPLAARLPLLSVASWSHEPTAWLDSQHARMAAIRPGCAHDGLFFLEDLVWPAGRQVLLPRLDHAQMCVGGGGFDHGRFWLALVNLFR